MKNKLNKKGRIRRAGRKIADKAKKLEENIINVPNFFTLLRVLITIIIIIFVFLDADILTIAILFVIGMITDFIDGNVARIFNMKTEFGRKFDMIADRFLMIGTVLAMVIHYSINSYFGSYDLLLVLFIVLREIICFPFLIYGKIKGDFIPHAAVVGKLVTVLQAVAFPVVILKLSWAWIPASITCFFGIISAITYAKNILQLNKE